MDTTNPKYELVSVASCAVLFRVFPVLNVPVYLFPTADTCPLFGLFR